MALAEDIKQRALQLGFDLVGITDASPINYEQFIFFTDWLAHGYAGRMDYMRDNLDKRTSPLKFLNGAHSIICLGLNYKPPAAGSPPNASAPMGSVANYAQYEDYHLFIKKLLRKLADFIASVAGPGFRFRICVDSAPVAERTLAARAGLGFIGKNRMLINPSLGPQIFLAEIITSLRLTPDPPMPLPTQVGAAGEPLKISCAACNKCVNACPTGALRPDGHFDANKCISYLTIEYKDQFPADLAPKIGTHLFGCNKCILACPYTANAPVCQNKQFRFFPDRAKLNLNEVLNMNERDFETKFFDSPIFRSGLDRLKRNARTCLSNLSPHPPIAIDSRPGRRSEPLRTTRPS